MTRHRLPNNLPNPGRYSSNHVLVNRERIFWGLKPLVRSVNLDEMARRHAIAMAESQTVRSSVSTVLELQNKLKARRVGENTLRGDSIRSIHKEVMTDPTKPHCRSNVLADGFSEFGVGTAIGEDGYLYLVQLFSGHQ